MNELWAFVQRREACEQDASDTSPKHENRSFRHRLCQKPLPETWVIPDSGIDENATKTVSASSGSSVSMLTKLGYPLG